MSCDLREQAEEGERRRGQARRYVDGRRPIAERYDGAFAFFGEQTPEPVSGD
jgi:hypothetical protein